MCFLVNHCQQTSRTCFLLILPTSQNWPCISRGGGGAPATGLNSSRKTRDARRCGSLNKWFPLKFVLQKNLRARTMALAFRNWCLVTNPVAPCCLSSWSRRQKKLEGAPVCKRHKPTYGATEQRFRLLSGQCPVRIQAGDYTEIFHSLKSPNRIQRWYIKIHHDSAKLFGNRSHQPEHGKVNWERCYSMRTSQQMCLHGIQVRK
jgi:hypothetical protein